MCHGQQLYSSALCARDIHPDGLRIPPLLHFYTKIALQEIQLLENGMKKKSAETL